MSGSKQPISRGLMGIQILLLLMPLSLLYLAASFYILAAIVEQPSLDAAPVALVLLLCAPCLWFGWQLTSAFFFGGRRALLQTSSRAWRWSSVGVALAFTATVLSQTSLLQSFLIKSQLGEVSLLQFGLPLLLPWLHAAIEKRLAMRESISQ